MKISDTMHTELQFIPKCPLAGTSLPSV